MLINKRLILAHFWLAFVVFGAGAGARRLADVRPQPAERLALQSGILLSLGHRARLGDGLRVSDPDRDGVWLRDHGSGAGKAAGRPPLGVGRLLPGRGRRRGGDDPGLAGLASVLYTFYPPMVGNPFYYIGVVMVVVGSWIWVALMSINLAIWKRENPGQAGAAGDVRQCRGLLSLGLDRGRRRARDHFPDPAGGARPDGRPSMPGWRACSSPGRCMPSSISG